MVTMKRVALLPLIMVCTMCSAGSDWQGVIDDDKNLNRPTIPADKEDTSDGKDPAGEQTPADQSVRIGVFTDAHYSATKANTTERFYQASGKKIADAVETFGKEKVDLVISLGDLVDNEYEDYEDIGQSLEKLTMPVYKVLGNHDFINPYSEEQQSAALKVLGITDRYFSVVKGGTRLIFLDSSDIATYSHPLESAGYRNAESILKTLKDDLAENARKYNGAISQTQMSWLESELKEATAASQNAVCFVHIPLAVSGAAKYTLWNGEDVIDVLSAYPCVKAVIAGHHHAGGYSSVGGLHHITLKGMVQGADTSYSILEISEQGIKIDGFGRENDIEYKFR